MKQIILVAILNFTFCFITFAQANENSCSQVGIILPNERLIPDKAELFTARFGKETYEYNIEHIWTVTRGYIIKGQGTSKIELLVTAEDFGENVVIALKINGLPKNCISDVSKTVAVISPPNDEPFSQYRKVSANDEKAQIDNLYYYLSLNENYKGIILLEFDRKIPVNKRIKRLEEVIKWLKLRKYDVSRLSFSIAEDDSKNTTILLLQEKSKIFENLSKGYKLIKGEEFEKKLNALFPKK